MEVKTRIERAIKNRRKVNKSIPTDITPKCDIAVNNPVIDINTGGESDVEVVSNAACSASGDVCDYHEGARVNDNTDCTKMNEPNRGNTSTLAEILKSNKHENSLHMVQSEVNENGVEIAVFDEEIIELGSAKWKMTVCGQFLGHEVDKCRMVPKESVVDNQSKEHADCNDGFKEVQYRKGRNENNNNKKNRYEQNGFEGVIRVDLE
ncbi:hypothetical protein CTI12_AA401440 [Artemisia annua]|uniref:Uncharacterized protein n=1 Tax=Artemisia annua TaxID=35608 RepID=A0A2U1MAN4_ARTAN|nr:hypothetical protein CTI12_AA401440 [Artemisia annua]